MALVHQHLSLGGKRFQIFNYIFIVFRFYSFFFQICAHFLVQHFALDEQDAALPCQVCVGHGHGIALHIAASDVEQPHQIVQLG